MNITRLDSQQIDPSKICKEYSWMDTLNKVQNGEITKGKKQILYALKIQVTYYAADSENFEKIKEEFYEKFTGAPTEALLQFTIRVAEQEKASFVDGYMNAISDFMYRQLSELRKELSNTLPVDIGDKELSLLIFRGAVDGLMSFTRGSKQSRTDWFTTPDIVQKCGTSGE